jgi:hypothetical protein
MDEAGFGLGLGKLKERLAELLNYKDNVANNAGESNWQ